MRQGLYGEAWEMFLGESRSDGYTLAETTFEFDLQLIEYVEAEWHEGGTRSNIGNLLSGLHHFVPPLRGMLRGSWRLHTAWGKQEMPDRAPPVPRLMVQALAGLALSLGFWDVALCILLQFELFLRTGEMASLAVNMFRFAADGSRAVIVLPFTKSSARTGATESVVLEDGRLVRCCLKFVSEFSPGDKILRRSPAQFRKLWKHLVSQLGQDPQYWRPYGLRRGGATEHFLRQGRLDRTALVGRWGSLKVARIYINGGLAMLNELELNEVEKERFEHLAATLARLPC